MKILPVRKRLSKPLASVATCASRQGNYHFRLAHVFASLFLPSRILIIKQFFYKINFMFNFQKTRISAIYFKYNTNNSKIEIYFAAFCLRKTRLFALRRLRGSFLHSVPELKALQSFADLHSFRFFCKTLIFYYFYYFFPNHLTTSIFCGNIPQQYDAG